MLDLNDELMDVDGKLVFKIESFCFFTVSDDEGFASHVSGTTLEEGIELIGVLK